MFCIQVLRFNPPPNVDINHVYYICARAHVHKSKELKTVLENSNQVLLFPTNSSSM